MQSFNSGPSRQVPARWRVYAVLALPFLLLPRFGEAAPGTPEPAMMKVRLLAPLTTAFTRIGDIVSGQVIEPQAYRGGLLEGEVKEVKMGGNTTKPSIMQFEIAILHFNGKEYPVAAALEGIANSSGQDGIDEAGTALELAGKPIGSRRSTSGEPLSKSFGAIRLSTKTGGLSLASGSLLVLQIQFRKTK